MKKDKASKKKIKKTLMVIGFVVLFFALLVSLMNIYVIHSTKKNIYDINDSEELPKADYIIVLGCSVRPDGTPSRMLRERVERGVELWKMGVAPVIIMSGDNEEENYNEVGCMRELAISLGVSSEAIIEDPLGLSTYESMYRAKQVYNVDSLIVVSHDYHLFRAVFDAKSQGIISYGVKSEKNYNVFAQIKRDIREVVARCKDVVFSIAKVKIKTEPINAPSAEPKPTASEKPTGEPTATPSENPGPSATENPTASGEPSATPMENVTATPTQEPKVTPSEKPSPTASGEPSATPTMKPTSIPTTKPTATPTTKPTSTPTIVPTPTPTPHIHEFERVKVIKAPTNDEKGIELLACRYCSAEKNKELDVIPNDRYVTLDYIESDGTQYIDTGYTISSNDSGSLSIDIQVANNVTQTWFGAEWLLELRNTDLPLERVTNSCTYNLDGNRRGKRYVNGEIIYDLDYSQHNLSNVKITLFNLGKENNAIYSDGKQITAGLIYGAELVLNGKQVGFYVPAIDVKTGKTGLLNYIDGKFLKSASSSSFSHRHELEEESRKIVNDKEQINYICPSCKYKSTITLEGFDDNNYAKLEYIKSTGTQYIDLGYSTTTGMRCYYNASFQGLGGVVIGSHNASDPCERNVGYPNLYDDYWELGFGDNFYKRENANIENDVCYEVLFQTISGHGYLKVFGIIPVTDNTYQSTSYENLMVFTTTYHLNLEKNRITLATLYGAKIWDENGTLIFELIPAKRILDNKPGLYDVVSGKFFVSETEDDFVTNENDTSKDASINDFNLTGRLEVDSNHYIVIGEVPTDKDVFNGKVYDGKSVFGNKNKLGSIAESNYSRDFDIYEIIIKDGDRIVSDYVPVSRKSDEKPGLFDKINNRFYELRAASSLCISDFYFTESNEFNTKIAELCAEFNDNQEKMATELSANGFKLISSFYEDGQIVTDISQVERSDKVSFKLYKKEVRKNGEKYNLYFLLLGGTGSAGQWKSNCTIGNNKSGFHEGFESTCDFVLEYINDKIDNDKEHNKFIITGYSRGAAVGSIVAAKLIEKVKCTKVANVYVYTFACPNYSLRSKKYTSFFNIVNPGDIIPNIPLSSWGFKREGINKTLPLSSNTMALLDSNLKDYQEKYGEEVVGYIGFTENITSRVNQFSSVISLETARKEESVNMLTKLALMLIGYNGNLTNEDLLYIVTQLNLSMTSIVDIQNFASEASSKSAQSHNISTYLCWFLAMEGKSYT